MQELSMQELSVQELSVQEQATNDLAIPTGRYRHYKGNDYEVIGVALHSETEQPLVVYRPLYGEGKLWVRPLEMFCEHIEVDGESLPRFEYLGHA